MKIRLSHWILGIAAAISTVGCAGFKEYNLPPAQRLLEPGPGVGGPGPGVIAPVENHGPPQYGYNMPPLDPTVQVLFHKPDGMQVRWDVQAVGQFDSEPLVVPGRNNFPQGGIYRLKLTNIPGREGVELYPTVEIGPTTPRTEAFLAHNAVPVQFTEEDFDQIITGNFVTKVIYLPDPEFQELALAGVETLVSTRLDPGVDPIVEADRRGSILAVVRAGNKDIGMPGANDDLYRGQGGGGYGAPYGAPCGPYGMGYGGGMPGMLPVNMPNYVSGVSTLPQYGMPYTGTPIGLPGPPHIPLGGPAGLQKHVMRNHTHMSIPQPVHKYKIHVKNQPGYSYPASPSRMHVKEQNIHPTNAYGQPHYMADQTVH